ncbi:MAG: cation:proton antiporter, partial [Burkholderiales bacterium]
LGLLLVTRLLAYVAKFRSNEMLLITVLGLCFGFCLLVIKLNYSIALGAFIMGAIIAEARPLQLIVKLVEPIRDMFSAIFFVTIGMLFEPQVMITYALPIAVITIAVVIGKVVTCTAGTFVVGHSGRTSFRVGMGLAQIGEFSFIIASLGLSLKVTSGFLYPIVVAVSAITTLLTPYLIKIADKVTAKPAASNPSLVSKGLNYYTKWLERMQPNGDNATLVKIIIRISLQVIVNCALVAAVFLAGVFMIASVERNLLGNAGWLSVEELQKTIICGGALFISLPFLIAAYRKLKALSMLFAEMVISRQIAGRHTFTIRKIIYELVPLLAIAGIMSLVFSFSAAILPPPVLLGALMIGAIIVALVLWKPFVWFHSWLQILLFDVMRQEKTQDKS